MKKASFYILGLLWLGCSKGPGEKDTTAPVITLTSPSNGEVYNAGDMILVTGTITDNQYIAEGHIHISNLGTGALLMDIHLSTGGKTADLNQFIVASAGTTYKIQVIAKDRNANETIQSVEVTCN